MINYELLRTFIAAGRAESFQKAAAARFVTVSAVSQQIKALEGQLGMALFQRLGRRVLLTPEGRALADALAPSLGSIDAALDAALHGRGSVAGLVRVGTPRAFGLHWLRPRLQRLFRDHPELTIQLEFDVPTVLERHLSEGRLDLALLSRDAALSTIVTHPVATERFQALAAPAYLARHGTPRTLQDFQGHRYGVFDPDLAMHGPWWRATFGGRAALPSRIVAEVPSLEMLLAMTLDGDFISVLPSYLSDPHVLAGELRVLRASGSRIRPGGLENTLQLAWRRGAVESARFVAVRDALLR